MRWMIGAWTVAFCLWALPSHAAVLDSWAFTSLGTLNASETVIINTDTLELTGGASYSGVLDPVSGASIFAFDNITGTNLSIFGTRTLGLLSKSNLAFNGLIDLLGSGGLEMVAVDSLAIKNLVVAGSGGDIQLHANHFTLSGSITSFDRSLNITSATDIVGIGVPGVLIVRDGAIPVISPGSILVVADRGTVAPVPLPASFLFIATGLVSLSLVKRRPAYRKLEVTEMVS
ncbi:MAG: hypothetical protein WCH20_05015 [Nitrospira sp.]